MRPKRLELEGFASFRERAEVDFGEASLFVLTGPTGAGKSSLVDAITFALYGCVARYQDKRLVAPVVTQGQLEARVRLDFSIGQEDFTAVRVVRKNKDGGATTSEARLEQGSRVLAGSESELSQRVEELIGLSFEHFTKCVVLPQGEFAQFLRDKPKDRQALLVRLLDIGVYGRMAHLAHARHKRAAEKADLNSDRLKQDFARATPAARREARQRAADLEKLSREVERAQPELVALAEKVRVTTQRVKEIESHLSRLRQLKPPAGLDQVAERLTQLEALEDEQRQQLEEVLAQAAQLEARFEELPDQVELAQLQKAWNDHANLSERLVGEEGEAKVAEQALAAQQKVLKLAQERLQVAERELERLKDAHAAAHLAGRLEVGAACPVCAQPVKRLPEIEKPRNLEEAEQEKKEARLSLQSAQANQEKAKGRLGVVKTQRDRTQEQFSKLEEQLSGQPSLKEVHRKLEEWAAGEADLKKSREREKRIREAENRLRAQKTDLKSELAKARKSFHTARDALIALEPPAVEEAGPAEAWARLLEWSERQIPLLEQSAREARQGAKNVHQRRDELEEKLREACRQAGLQPGDRLLMTVCTEALTNARGSLQRIEQDLKRARQLRAEIKSLRDEATVAREMARLLGSRGFERWYLNRALRQLIAGASQILLELSSSQYSLTLDEKGSDFLVVDHTNADERRLARTLSGGETFLASLSLALALSEHVAGLSARGAARLEAIFLDEGFGMLDPDTLEIVATAIEALGSQGRMVGLITHVSELARRIPVRYEVRKDAQTSSVRKVLQ